MALEVGQIVEGTVVGITNYGAFIELPDGKTGLIHISEIADTFVQDIHQFLKEKEKVKVKIIGLTEKGKYDLSLRQVEGTSRPQAPRKGRGPRGRHSEHSEEDDPEKRSRQLSFEEKLTKFMKESEERLLDLKRNVEAKRGKGRTSR